jgi:hypothetical protein
MMFSDALLQIEWQGGGQLKWVMACEAEVIRDLIPRLRGIDVPKLCGDAYRHCFKRGRENTETIQDSMAAEEREAAARVCTSLSMHTAAYRVSALLRHLLTCSHRLNQSQVRKIDICSAKLVHLLQSPLQSKKSETALNHIPQHVMLLLQLLPLV